MECLYGLLPIIPARRFDQYFRRRRKASLDLSKPVKGHNMTQLFSVIPMWFLVAQAVLIGALIVGQVPYGK